MSHRRRLGGKIAVVTGASSGVGRAIARALGAEGARVGLIARNVDGLHAAARLGYLLPDTHRELELMVRRTAAPLAGLIRSVRRGKGLASHAAQRDGEAR